VFSVKTGANRSAKDVHAILLAPFLKRLEFEASMKGTNPNSDPGADSMIIIQTNIKMKKIRRVSLKSCLEAGCLRNRGNNLKKNS